MSKIQLNLDLQRVAENRPLTRKGLVWIFENCLVYTDDYRDILTMGMSKRRRKKMGQYWGIIFGEVPDLGEISASNSRILYEWIRDDPKIEKRKKLKRFLRAHPKLKKDLKGVLMMKDGKTIRSARIRPLTARK